MDIVINCLIITEFRYPDQMAYHIHQVLCHAFPRVFSLSDQFTLIEYG